eukprot:TRINITY_DN1350_c0_g1_i1.p1 TRINITY_DN1350_c0_g1~~TRINITY_DN1350_c0_g1_i1.p1  ORF type:complete len:136 (+),score=38.94 TRINITY_DN1350_c0_g1_i1:122-529(+)
MIRGFLTRVPKLAFGTKMVTPGMTTSFVRAFGGGHGPVNKDGIILRREASGYYADPNDIARRLIKLISTHDKVKNPSQITLNSSFVEIGIDELSFVEVMLEAENEFGFEFADEDLERMYRVSDAVEYIARSFNVS